jgi:hypothetical protein
MHAVICEAIEGQRLLVVHQEHGMRSFKRVVEPYVLYPAPPQTLLLESRVVDGDAQDTPLSSWCTILLAEITYVTIQEEEFIPHPTYNPYNARYQWALCRLMPRPVLIG